MVFGSGAGDEGSKGMMGTIVFMTVFVLVFSILLGYAAPLLFAGGEASGPTSRPEGFDAASYSMITFFETSNGNYAYQMSPGLYGTGIVKPAFYLGGNGLGDAQTDAARNLSFDAGDFNVYLYPLKDSKTGNDEFWFFSHTGWISANFFLVTESDIERRMVDGKASVPISCGGSFTAYFTFPDDHDASYYLDQRSGFNVSIGQSLVNATTDSTSFWNVITGLLTFNLPNGGTGILIFDIILSTAFISCCAFILFWAVTRIF